MAEAIAQAEARDDVEDADVRYERPQPPRRPAGDVYTFRLPKTRRDELRRAAERRGVPPATLIREWVEEKLERDSRRAVLATAMRDASLETGAAPSRSKPASVTPIVDLEGLAEHLQHRLSDEQWRGLAAIGALAPSFLKATQSIARDIDVALTGLLGTNERLTDALVHIGLADTPELAEALLRFEPTWTREGSAASLAELDRALATSGQREQRIRVAQPRATATTTRQRHVLPNPHGGWDVRAPGSQRASAHTASKDEAVRRAREIVRNAGGGEVVIYGRDGSIRKSDTIRPPTS